MQSTLGSRLKLMIGFGLAAVVVMAGKAVVDYAEEIRTVVFSVQWPAAAPSDVWYIDSSGRHDVPMTRVAPTTKQLYSGGQWTNGDTYIRGVRYELHATAPNGNPLTIEIHAGTHLAQDHANTNHRQLFALLEAAW